MSNIIHQTGGSRTLVMQEPEKPQLYRELFPYTSVCRTSFDEVLLSPRPADQMRITDTTFRDGQQARSPYTVEEICDLFTLLHKLDNGSGIIRQTEFFLYSPKDKEAVLKCQE